MGNVPDRMWRILGVLTRHRKFYQHFPFCCNQSNMKNNICSIFFGVSDQVNSWKISEKSTRKFFSPKIFFPLFFYCHLKIHKRILKNMHWVVLGFAGLMQTLNLKVFVGIFRNFLILMKISTWMYILRIWEWTLVDPKSSELLSVLQLWTLRTIHCQIECGAFWGSASMKNLEQFSNNILGCKLCQKT